MRNRQVSRECVPLILIFCVPCSFSDMCGSRGGGGGDRGSGPPPPLQNHKNIGFLSNIDPDPLKMAKLPSQHSMVGHYRHASETPLEWRFDGVPIMSHFKWHFDPLSIPSSKKTKNKTKKKQKKNAGPL